MGQILETLFNKWSAGDDESTGVVIKCWGWINSHIVQVNIKSISSSLKEISSSPAATCVSFAALHIHLQVSKCLANWESRHKKAITASYHPAI